MNGESLIAELGHLGGPELLRPLIERFRGRIALVSSFGAESAVLLSMVAEIDRSTPVVFIDTGKLFWETKYYRSKLVDHLGLTDIRTVRPFAGDLAWQDPTGDLHKSSPDHCCHIRKTRSLRRTLEGFEAWIAGRKRYHGADRSDLPTLSLDEEGRLKADPLAHMGHEEVTAYIEAHDLPSHPLTERGYLSIGCMPCTVKGGTPDNPRSGRWAGSEKTECGIHWSVNGRPIRINRAA